LAAPDDGSSDWRAFLNSQSPHDDGVEKHIAPATTAPTQGTSTQVRRI
jgi:hypothetical protein